MKKFNSDVVIGLEIHVELATDTKLFCGCKTHGTDEPNTRTCEVCLGHPGSKPVLNKKAVDYALKLCLALGCKISPKLIFSRKSYFYPDMAKNYQISQYEIPLGIGGKLKLGSEKEIGITRVHMEEDPASLVHPNGMSGSSYVLIDYNRSGDPLCEVVTEPDMTSPEEARDFMKQLITVLTYLEIFDVNRCIIKADANISIKETNYSRVEIKNITGFKEIERALKYEVQRQQQEKGSIVHETRAWDSEKGMTISMRKKEVEEEYGYIIDPDLVITEISKEKVKEVQEKMPELAQDKIMKYEEKHGKVQSMSIILKNPKLAKFFEEVVAKGIDEKLASYWVEFELQKVLNRHKKNLDETGITPQHMADIVNLIESKKITKKVGVSLFEKLGKKIFDVNKYVEENDLLLVDDESELNKLCKDVIEENGEVVNQYKSGAKEALNFLIGKIMKATKGKADPYKVREIMENFLK